jgi:putative transposase
MYLQGSLLPDWESVPKLSKGGSKRGKSKEFSPRLDKEDTMWTQLSVLDLPIQKMDEQASFMPEFQAAVKRLTLNNKYSFLSLTTPMRNLLPTSEADSISTELVFKPYWTEFSQTLASLLSLPTKIGFVALGSILSHGCVLGSRLKYWFSTKRTSAQSEKWLRIFSQSSTCSAADCMDSESTKSRLIKTLSYRVYPSKELEKIWKKWLAAVRKVYNISIAYLNKHQGYKKVR